MDHSNPRGQVAHRRVEQEAESDEELADRFRMLEIAPAARVGAEDEPGRPVRSSSSGWVA
jgi:hypothetical protein